MTEIPTRIIKVSKDPKLPITVRIGKLGVIDSVIDEISDQLSKRSIVKIKINRGVVSDSGKRSELFSFLASSTSSRISFSRGNVVVLWSGN
tara:strand:+ start:16619 stop:16891 length:273 start_codon:yes stop_codon:yes gene_type:complete